MNISPNAQLKIQLGKDGNPKIYACGTEMEQKALCAALIAGVWFFWRTDARYKPGFLVGLASLIYGLSRFTVEFFREPDVQRQWVVDATGLSMGQWLTILSSAIAGPTSASPAWP